MCLMATIIGTPVVASCTVNLVIVLLYLVLILFTVLHVTPANMKK